MRSISAVELNQLMQAPASPLLLDVRRQHAAQADPETLPGAQWRNPEAVAEWAPALEAGRPIVVFCVKGAEVGTNTAAALCEQGFDALVLEGGLLAWREQGLDVVPLPQGD